MTPIQQQIKSAEGVIAEETIEAIAVIAKMSNGKYHRVLIKKSDTKQILHFIAGFSISGAVELDSDAIDFIDF